VEKDSYPEVVIRETDAGERRGKNESRRISIRDDSRLAVVEEGFNNRNIISL
jgi:hypothetical protein